MFFWFAIAFCFLIFPFVLFGMLIATRERVKALEQSVKTLNTQLRELKTRTQTLSAVPTNIATVSQPSQEKTSSAEPELPAEPIAPPTPAIAPALNTPPAPVDLEPDVLDFADLMASAEPRMDSPRPPSQSQMATPTSLPEAQPPVPAPISAPSPTPSPQRAAPSPATSQSRLKRPAPRSTPPQATWLQTAQSWLFGGNLVAKMGLFILFIGVSFLVKYTVSRFSIPIEFRLSAIALADIGLLLWGWRIRRSRPNISLPVQGGALGILMLITFSAFRLYNLIPAGLAFFLLLALTLFTCLLAVLQDAFWLALFGIVEGFAAPLLTSTGHGNHVALFSYYALLNAGILGISLKRAWRTLNLVGFAFTFAIGTAWGVLRYQPENYFSAQGFLILFFLFYVFIAVLYAHHKSPQHTRYVDGTLVFGTPILAFGLQYGLVRYTAFGLAYSALALGIFYLLLARLLWDRRGRTLQYLVESFLGLGTVFATLSIPLALDGRWTSAAWALEGAGVAWVGLRQRQPLTWAFGVLVQIGAWLAFLRANIHVSEVSPVESNLWLGFLLLALTGFAMAVNFKKAAQNEDDAHDPWRQNQAFLSAFFLVGAAAWLLTGLWREVALYSDVYLTSLLVLCALLVSGLLFFIGKRMQWVAARYCALAGQALAVGAFLFHLDVRSIIRPDGDFPPLWETDFLGALLITLSTGFSACRFYQSAREYEEESPYSAIAHALLSTSLIGWFIFVLGLLALWIQGHLGIASKFLWATPPYPVYGGLIALSVPLFVYGARRLDWAAVRLGAYTVWPVLTFTLFVLLIRASEFHQTFPQSPAWLAGLALWCASEWLLIVSQKYRWLTVRQHLPLLRILHVLRTVGPWCLLWPVIHHFTGEGLAPEIQPSLIAGEEEASGSWANYFSAWAMMGSIALLMLRARQDRWPTPPLSAWYRQVLLPIGSYLMLLLACFWNLTQDGRMAPLPYLPVLNPLDLTMGFAVLLAVTAWRGQDPEQTGGLFPAHFLQIAWGAGYVWFNLILLRTTSHFMGIPYHFSALFQSLFVQAMLSLVWSTTGLILMKWGANQRRRSPWIVGAGFLGVVVIKLFLIDLSGAGSIERIISFLGVGLLMLATDYLAPFPQEKKTNS